MLETFTFLAAAASDENVGLVREFGINHKMIIAQIVNFGIVAFLLWRFAFKPVLSTMDERQRKISEGLKFAEDAKRELAETEKRQATVLREANAQAQDILQAARDSAQQFEDKMKAETASQIEEMRRRAEESNELERQRMISEVRQEIARLVVLTSGRVLQRELTDIDRERLSAKAAEEIARHN
jgi:F-type H+-transporting ATPase subunit b